jgi:predicted transcriptional regulator
MTRLTLLLLCALAVTHASGQETLSPSTPLAKVGAQTITAEEFLSRYELTPGLQRHNPGKTEERKAEFLFTLIAEKLLAQQARAEGLDRDTSLLRAVHGVERLFVRDELYRKEVRDKVTLSETEIDQAMTMGQQDCKVYFLFAATKETADSLMAVIQRGKPLESFAASAGPRMTWDGPDSAMTRWGDADERMEAAVYGLKLGQTSRPVHLDDGYYIVKLMGKSITVFQGEQQKKSLRERVVQILRKRKEQKRMFDFIASALKSTRVEIKAKATKNAIIGLFDAYKAALPAGLPQADTTKFILTRDIIDAVLSKNREDAGKPYVVFQQGEWSLATVLEKMRSAGLAIERPTLSRVRFAYEQRLHDLIDQENLTQIGYQRQLQHTSAVQNELGPWRDWYLAQLYKNTIEDTLSASQQEVENEKWRMRYDSLAQQDTSKARASVIAMKLKYIADRKLGALADKFGITVYEKNVEALKVTTVPAMVYRYLGFGGRMFAVPLTEPNIQWVNFWERKNLRLP